MTTVPYRFPAPAPRRPALWSVASLVRWLLVLLLVVDQIGSPLHPHRHDAGFDGGLIGGAHQVASRSDVSRVAGDPCEPGVFHAITAIRFEVRLAVAAAPDGHHTRLAAACAAPAMADRLAVATQAVRRPEPAATPHPLFRSLPPETRAPPRHA